MMKTDPRKRPAAGLSPWARGVWRELLALHDFAEHELVSFTRALKWWDLSDRWMAESETATGRDQARLVKPFFDVLDEPTEEVTTADKRHRPTTHDWQPPTRWRCLRCEHVFATSALMPRCPLGGFREAD